MSLSSQCCKVNFNGSSTKKRNRRDLDLEENSPGFLLWLHIRKRGFYISDSIVSLVVYRVKSRVITPIQKPEHFISSLMLSFFPVTTTAPLQFVI